MSEKKSSDDDSNCCCCCCFQSKLYSSLFLSDLRAQIDIVYARLHLNETNLNKKNKIIFKWLKLINKIDSIENKCLSRQTNDDDVTVDSHELNQTLFFLNEKLFILNNQCFSVKSIRELKRLASSFYYF